MGMNKAPNLIMNVVKQNHCIGCGLCVVHCPENALQMTWSEDGFYIPSLIKDCEVECECIHVCPFNPNPSCKVRTEDEISDLFLQGSISSHPRIGKFINLYAGYADAFRNTSSSGGMATYLFKALIDRKVVDHIVIVKSSDQPGVYYEYDILSSEADIIQSSETKYFPVNLSDVISRIEKNEGTYAIIGVPCFIKALRLAQEYNRLLNRRLVFMIGIVCGGVKSSFFTDFMLQKAGISKNDCTRPEYRIKDPSSTAHDYSFGGYDRSKNKHLSVKVRSVGDMWGTGLFKANSCDLCDDVMAELADISLGDAWLPPFNEDGKGNNIIITRTALAEKIITEGIQKNELKLSTISLDKMIQSQKGSFKHRQDAIQFRAKRIQKIVEKVPPKRYYSTNLSLDYKIVQIVRMHTRRKSLQVWKDTRNSNDFIRRMRVTLWVLRKVTIFHHYALTLRKKLKISRSLETTKGSLDARLKINELVREIDKCIVLMNK